MLKQRNPQQKNRVIFVSYPSAEGENNSNEKYHNFKWISKKAHNAKEEIPASISMYIFISRIKMRFYGFNLHKYISRL